MESQATSTYLLQQEATLNFTCNTMDEFTVPSRSCVCAPGDIHHCNIDLIGILHQQPRRSIPFCKCIPNLIQLLHYGYFAASTNTPQTSFSIRLIQLHHFIWKTLVISTSAFVKGLSAFLDTRSPQPLFSRSVHFRKRNLCIPFSYSVDLNSRIMALQKKLLSYGLQLSAADNWADKCPQCFGPSVNEFKADPNEPDFIIALDGNFQQHHYAHASKDNPCEHQYPDSLIKPSKIMTDKQALEDSELLAQDYTILFPSSKLYWKVFPGLKWELYMILGATLRIT
ncbi:hypothetical protein PtB15_9B65 [Puccinia triticina]|nr:hypothetical protein PtB15_9B65 [Puccinia triticina]